jgi:sucrose phosphorylase
MAPFRNGRWKKLWIYERNVKNQAQLIAYVDRFSGGGLREFQSVLQGPLEGVFGGVHLLPFFYPIDGADAGFDPIDHTRVDPRLGTWGDLRAVGEQVEIMADLIVNHVSSRSPQFEDFRKNGADSAYADLFLTYGKVFPKGASESDLLKIYRPRPGLPFTAMRLEDGTEHLLWTTFTSEQIDIDVQSSAGRAYLEEVLNQFHAAGVRTIRLDAAGYAIKKCGTPCFMVPETFDFIRGLAAQAHASGIEVLVEIHTHYQNQIQIARQVDWVYDFALPPLVLHTLYTHSAVRLKHWLTISPRNAVTVLDTHDGIGVIDVGPVRTDTEILPGLLTAEEVDALVETVHRRSNDESRRATGAAANNLDLYQVNCTYYDALGRRDDEYLIARALQFFAPGVPQVYYVGLLAGTNDMDLLRRTGVGRDINRRCYSRADIEAELRRPVVRSLRDLIRFRSTHAAFAGEFHLLPGSDHEISIEWRKGSRRARLDVDLKAVKGAIAYSVGGGEERVVLDPGRSGEIGR